MVFKVSVSGLFGTHRCIVYFLLQGRIPRLNNRVCHLVSSTLTPFSLTTVKGVGSYLVNNSFNKHVLGTAVYIVGSCLVSSFPCIRTFQVMQNTLNNSWPKAQFVLFALKAQISSPL